jgi:fatty-acyl-CoA synthase
MARPATLGDLLDRGARRFGERPALSLGGQVETYTGFAAAVDRLASRLAPDVTVGQRVGIVAPNVPVLAIALFAAWKIGAVAVPLSARYREYEVRRFLEDAEPTVVVTVEAASGFSFAALFRTLLPELPTLRRCLLVDPWGEIVGEIARQPSSGAGPAAPLDPAFAALLYTSGSTGEPKGVLVTHRRELEAAAALSDVLSAGPDDRCVFVVSLAHAFGLSCFAAAVAAGSEALLVPTSLSPAPMMRVIAERAATLLHGSPALFASLLKADTNYRWTLRTGFVAGATCPPALLAALDPDLPILNLYGTTETGAVACCRLEDAPALRFNTVGRPLPGYEVRTFGGEVQVRGRAISPGYVRQSAQTAAAVGDGWIRTGDLGAVDDRGYLTITGRIGEMIQVAGHTVSPAEVEGLLLTHPDIAQVVVAGVPHETMGEVLQAFVVARPGAEIAPAALLQFARARIAGYKLPYAITMVPEIPTLASGKPDRRAMARAVREAADVGRRPTTFHDA